MRSVLEYLSVLPVKALSFNFEKAIDICSQNTDTLKQQETGVCTIFKD